MSKFNELKSTLNQIEERADNTITFDKVDEYSNGLKEIEQSHGDKYTPDALNEVIEEYKTSKSEAIKHELSAFDDQSQSLLDKAHKRIEQLDGELSTAIDPNSQYELDKHNYILNKLQNELSSAFTGQRPTIKELDEVLNQAKYNKLYANALLQVQNMLIQNIVNNSNIDTSLEMTLRSALEDRLGTVKYSILPEEYHELEELKARLESNKLASSNKNMMFDFLMSNRSDGMKVAQ
ncbi:hypothetical protein M4K87_13440 [Staphylococcus equorum]|uniref:hypothetical protein n=1 Tax=Staphylococcus equorum TaxID=246432 RepID=UPI002407E5B0|nr:hypothetical protein [Staphylococcus equorum]MDG0826445.1 hypothetical protein [Staphylococcus equorum]